MPPRITRQSPGRQADPNDDPAAAGIADAWDLTDRIKINVYGRSATGKTTFWATFPKPIVALICSGGGRPGELKSIRTQEYRATIRPKVVRRSEQIPAIMEQFGRDAETVVLDHASGLQDLVLMEILGREDMPAQKSFGMASQKQYGECTLRCKEIFRTLLNLDKHVVIVAQERDFNTDGEASDLLMPFIASGLTPSLVGWLNPAVDYICQTFIRPMMTERVVKIGSGKGAREKVIREPVKGKVEYCLRTAPDPVYTTKFRIPRGRDLPQVIVDPDYDKLDALINGEE
jgi:hypothetical protein